MNKRKSVAQQKKFGIKSFPVLIFTNLTPWFKEEDHPEKCIYLPSLSPFLACVQAVLNCPCHKRLLSTCQNRPQILSPPLSPTATQVILGIGNFFIHCVYALGHLLHFTLHYTSLSYKPGFTPQTILRPSLGQALIKCLLWTRWGLGRRWSADNRFIPCERVRGEAQLAMRNVVDTGSLP